MKTLFALTTFAALAVAPAPLYAQKIWLGQDQAGGNGAWGTSGHWSPAGAPTSTSTLANRTFFAITSEATATSSTTTLTGTNYSNSVQLGKGRTVTLTLEAGAVLNAGSFASGIDYTGETGTGASHLTINGVGTVNTTQLLVGFAATTNSSGNTLTFSGPELVVATVGTVTPSLIGRHGDDNKLHFTNGVDASIFGFSSSTLTGKINNGVVVDKGAKLTTTSSDIALGAVAGARSNYLVVKGNGTVDTPLEATMEIQGAKALLIGNNVGYGGNYVEVADGGTLKQSGKTTISIFNANGGDNDGRNRLTIGSGGTFTAAAAITNNGLVQLADGGKLEGKNLAGGLVDVEMTVSNEGRFEVEGDGLAANVTTNVNKDGVFAVGVAEVGGPARSEEALLTLQSTVNLASESVLEMTLFGNGQGDQILFDGGTLNLTGGVKLSLNLGTGFVPEAGDSWTLFTGTNVAILGTGNFDLSGLDPALWDVSLMNAAGGWQIVAIPEPSSYVLMFTSAAALGVALRRRRS